MTLSEFKSFHDKLINTVNELSKSFKKFNTMFDDLFERIKKISTENS